MRTLAWVAATLLLGLVAVTAFALWRLDGEALRPELETRLGEQLGRAVQIRALTLQKIPLRLKAHGLRIADDPGSGPEPFLIAESLRVDVDLWALLRDRRLHLQGVRLEQPRLRLVEMAPGVWNGTSLGRRSDEAAEAAAEGVEAGPALRLGLLELVDGEARVEARGEPPRTYAAIELQVREVGASTGSPFRLSMRLPGGGNLRAEGRAGPRRGQFQQMPFQALIDLEGADLAGAVPTGDPSLQGRLDAAIDVSGENGQLRAQGTATSYGLRLLGTEEVGDGALNWAFELGLDLPRHLARVDRMQLLLGDARLDLSGSLGELDDTPRAALALRGAALPVDGLQALLPALGVALPERSRLVGGEMDIDLRLEGPLDALRIAGPLALRNATLEGFSLGGSLAGVSLLAGVPLPAETRIREAGLSLRGDPRVTRLDDFRAELIGLGTLQGEGEIARSGQLDLRARLDLEAPLADAVAAQARSGGRLGRAGAALARSGLSLRVDGDLDAPRFRLDGRGLARDLLPALLGGERRGEDEEESKPDPARALLDALRGNRD
ncbi:AsmA family protein [Pseudomarimonas salicorniae]|uniref:AsmA family protein n=1 Tax=Pseudomarimonas salicorniae TaxID=2933270 RepID=A0ABT0GG28_9GAMM|nr:AsmA family protein [Lysobacter sp. CAU 1642]MCK7593501.1 AsmA family protein [Lysobacter sp. CAU 1642]